MALSLNYAVGYYLHKHGIKPTDKETCKESKTQHLLANNATVFCCTPAQTCQSHLRVRLKARMASLHFQFWDWIFSLTTLTTRQAWSWTLPTCCRCWFLHNCIQNVKISTFQQTFSFSRSRWFRNKRPLFVDRWNTHASRQRFFYKSK